MGRTAYFIFSGEQRARVRDKLQAERGGDAKVSVADVAKEIGALWKQLSEEEKQKYKDAAAAENSVDTVTKNKGDASKKQQRALLPLSLVKKIVCRDEEVKRVSGDAVRIIAEATGMFIGLLASQSYEYAKGKKRKNFKFSDIEAVARGDSRMREIGLPLSFDHEDVFVRMKQGRGDADPSAKKKKKASGEAEDDKQGGSGVVEKTDKKNKAAPRTLHSFFSPRTREEEGEKSEEGVQGDVQPVEQVVEVVEPQDNAAQEHNTELINE